MSNDIGLYKQVDENTDHIREINKFIAGFKEVNKSLADYNHETSIYVKELETIIKDLVDCWRFDLEGTSGVIKRNMKIIRVIENK